MTEFRYFSDRDTIIGNNIAYTLSGFFRPENTNDMALATDVVPVLHAEHPGTPVTIADIGCSRGMDTLSLAAAIATQDYDFSVGITGCDVNPVVIGQAGSYPFTKDALSSRIARWGLPLASVDLFDESEGHIAPGPHLQSMVTFTEHDILEAPLPPGDFDAVVLNNVLPHFNPIPQKVILRNAAETLRVGGILTASDAVAAPSAMYEACGLVRQEQWRDLNGLPAFYRREA